MKHIFLALMLIFSISALAQNCYDADGSYLGKCDNGRFYDSYGRYA